MAGILDLTFVDIRTSSVNVMVTILAVAFRNMALGSAGAMATLHITAGIKALVTFGITGLVGGTVFMGFTLDLVATNVGVTRISAVFGRAGTEGLVVNNPTGGLWGTVADITGVEALLGLGNRIFEASKLGLAFIVPSALVWSLAAKDWILDHIWWARTNIRARNIGAPHIWV